MHLDLNTLLYVSTAAAVLGAAVLSFFGSVQGTHSGFRWWADGRSLWVASRPASYHIRSEKRACTGVGKFSFTTSPHCSVR